MPQPKISSHPEFLQTAQPLPPHTKHSTSISADGSVKGKYEARKRVRTFWPNILRAKSINVPFRSAKVMFSPTTRPSTWLNWISERAVICS